MMILRILLLLFISISNGYADDILVAVTPDDPPFSLKVDQHNHYTGIDLDIMSEVCKRTNLQCRYTSMPFSQLFSSINTNQIDLAVASIIITPDRQKQFLFSLPYLASSVQFLTNQQSPLNTPEDLKHKRIGMRQGTPFEPFLNNLYKNQIKIVKYLAVPDLLVGLSNKEVDAITLDRDAARYWYANNSDQYKLIGTPIPFGGGYSIVAKLGQEPLIAEINKALLRMEADGTYLKIYTRYFG